MFEGLRGRKAKIIDFDEYRQFGLCIPLTEHDGQICVVFEVRAMTLRRQPGEVCLPGGRVEEGEDYAQAALRELSEELCIPAGQAEMIAPMDMSLSPGGQLVVPFLVQLHEYTGTYNSAEVDHVFYVPLTFFLENEPKEYKNRVYTEPAQNFPLGNIPGGKNYRWQNGWNTVYFYPAFEGEIIWGLTAKIMRAAVRVMRREVHEGYANME